MIELFVTVPAAAPNEIPLPTVAVPPIVPDIISEPFSPLVPFLVMAPTLDPKAFWKSEVAVTINASIKTCCVLTSISFSTASITSKSGFLPLTIIDLVIFSSVIWIVLKVLVPSGPWDLNKFSKVVLASDGLI